MSQTKLISTYSGSVVAGDWSPAFLAAFNAIKTTGGTIFVDQDVVVKTSVSYIPTPVSGVAPVPIIIASDGGSIISVEGTNTVNPFTGGNLEQFSTQNLTIVADTAGDDAQGVFIGAYVEQLNIDHSVFAGIQAANILLAGASSELHVRNCLMGGGSHSDAAIRGDGARIVSVKNTKCIDYDSLRNVYRSKTPNGVNAWIKATGLGPTSGDSSSATLLEVENFIGDEGAGGQIVGEDLMRVTLRNVSGNLNGGGVGIDLTSCNSVLIDNCWMGYTANDRPAVRLTNCGDVEINRLQTGGGVTRVEVDANTRLTLRNSPGVVIDRV